jgi:hypothetical protein
MIFDITKNNTNRHDINEIQLKLKLSFSSFMTLWP